MKRSKALIAICVGLLGAPLMVSTAAAQDVQALISARDGSATAIATTPALTLHDAFGAKGFDLDARAFAGLGFDAGKLSGGLILSHRVPVARELVADVGLYGRWRAGEIADAGLFVGFGWRL